jgi:hypothetical protein
MVIAGRAAKANKEMLPKIRADGSWCVEVTIPVRSDDEIGLRERVQQWWTDVWVPNRNSWRRVGRTGPQLREEVVETLTYTDQFSAAPHVVFCKDSQLKFRLEGSRHPSSAWKDWLVLRILPDLREQFPEIQEGLGSVSNCD